MVFYLPLEQNGRPIFRGHHHYWVVIRELDGAQGLWTTNDIFDGSVSQRSNIVTFVNKLELGGFVGIEKAEAGENYYRLLKRSIKTPRVTKDGAVVPPNSQQNLWNIMRNCSPFSIAQLAFMASTDELAVNERTATVYVMRLVTAGVVLKLGKAAPKTDNLFVLPHANNTGIHSPSIMSARFVFDMNTQKVVGNILASEVGEKAA